MREGEDVFAESGEGEDMVSELEEEEHLFWGEKESYAIGIGMGWVVELF